MLLAKVLLILMIVQLLAFTFGAVQIYMLGKKIDKWEEKTWNLKHSVKDIEKV